MKHRFFKLLSAVIFMTLFCDTFAQYVRPFGPNAPWNIPVDRIKVHPESDHYSELLWYNAPADPGNFNLSFDSYAYPVYEATDETQEYMVQSANPTWGNLHGKFMPYEPSWLPASGTDAQIIVLDPKHGYEWDL